MDSEAEAALALEELRFFAAGLAEVPDETASGWLSRTRPLVSKKRFGRLWLQALALLTAHRMEMASVGREQGADPLGEVAALGIGGLTRVASYSEGSRSISFNGNMAQHAALEAEYALTPYGIQYLGLLRRTAPSITSAWER